jgi:iron complex transport system substrate-binding protein
MTPNRILRSTVVLIFFLALITGASPAFPLNTSDEEVAEALDYLHSCQRENGGFAEEGRETNPGTSFYATMAIVVAGEDPETCTVNGTSAADYWRSGEVKSDGTAEIARMVTLIVALGEDPRDFAGTDYLAQVQERMGDDGHFGDHIYTHYWGMFALAAAGEDAASSAEWLKSQQNNDGGFGWTPGTESDPDDTAASIMALIAAGEPVHSATVRDALAYLDGVQMEDGGFNFGGTSTSNVASDAWVIQALAAAGEDPASWEKNGNDVVGHLLSLRTEEGLFRWTDGIADNPCGMTARAVPALLGKPYPILPEQDAVQPDTAPEKLTPSPPLRESVSPAPPATQTAPAEGERTVTDDYGNEVTIVGTPERIISLAPSNTEILFALDLGDRVVGATDYCNYPPEVEEIEKVGGYSTPNVEKILSLNPDLVVAAFGNTEEVHRHLTDLGLTVISLNPESVEDVFTDIDLVGQATGAEAEAQALTAEMRARIDAVTSKTATARPRTVHVVWYDPIWVSGGDTVQAELVEMAGGENAFPEIKGHSTVPLETFITTNPEVIIVNEGTGMGDAGRNLIYDYFMTEPRLQDLDAVKKGRVYLINSDIIDRPGPRIVDALEMLAADIHPELFGGQAGEAATPAPTPGFRAAAGIVAVVCAGLGAWISRR